MIIKPFSDFFWQQRKNRRKAEARAKLLAELARRRAFAEQLQQLTARDEKTLWGLTGLEMANRIVIMHPRTAVECGVAGRTNIQTMPYLKEWEFVTMVVPEMNFFGTKKKKDLSDQSVDEMVAEFRKLMEDVTARTVLAG